MKPITNIQDWQQSANDISHPMYNMWKIDMQRSVLNDTKWLEQPDDRNLVTLESWKRYRFQASQPNFVNWASSPDIKFNELYRSRSIALETLYTQVHMILGTFSYDPFISDIYREKAEQAIQYMSMSKLDRTYQCPALISIECSSPQYPNPDEAYSICESIIRKRTEWVNKISRVESIRLQTKRSILTEVNSETINKITQNAVKLLIELYKQWI